LRTPTVLNTPSPAVTLVLLAVDIVSEAVDVAHYAPDFVVDERTGGGRGGMPPGAVHLYVFTR